MKSCEKSTNKFWQTGCGTDKDKNSQKSNIVSHTHTQRKEVDSFLSNSFAGSFKESEKREDYISICLYLYHLYIYKTK